MIRTLLRSFGIPQNSERIKTEIEAEIEIQRQSLKARVKAVRDIGLWSVIFAVFGVISWILACVFFYLLIARYYDPLLGLGLILAVHVLIVAIAALKIRAASDLMPASVPIQIPSLYVEPLAETLHSPVPGFETGEEYLETYLGSGFPPVEQSDKGLRSWMEQTLTNSVFRAASVHPDVQNFVASGRPQVADVARSAIDGATDTLKSGGRSSVWGVLALAALAGVVLGKSGDRSKKQDRE